MLLTPTKQALMNELIGGPTELPPIAPPRHEVTDKERRRSIAKGLIAAAKSIGSNKGDFLTAVGQGVPAGAEAYLGGIESAETQGEARAERDMKRRRQRALDALKARVTLDKDKRAATAAKAKNALTEARTRDISTDNARADERLKLQQSASARADAAAETKAKADAIKLKQLENEADTGNTDKQALRRKQTEAAVSRFAKRQGLGSDDFMSPEDRAARETKVSEYRAALEKQMGLKPLYGEPGASAPAASKAWMPKKGETYTKENPATPMTREARDALPKGAIFRNPSDGKLYIVK